MDCAEITLELFVLLGVAVAVGDPGHIGGARVLCENGDSSLDCAGSSERLILCKFTLINHYTALYHGNNE